MLSELSVKDFGIIEEATWKPAKGLNVISGETGAGKSLVVDAVEALLSGQAQEEDIRYGSEDSRVEGIFRLPDEGISEQLQEMLSEKGLEMEDNALLFTCDFRRQGRTTPRINRQAVPRNLLQDIGSLLVDIHGQSGHLSLLDKENHLDFLDGYAHTRNLRRDFSNKAAELNRAIREIEELQKADSDSSKQTELVRFQIDEIRQAELKESEEEELEKELVILASAEKLKAAAYDVYSIVHGDDNSPTSSSALDRLSEALPALKKMAETDSSLKDFVYQLDDTVQALTEISRDIHAYGDKLEFDSNRMEMVQTRLDLIRSLKRKYGSTLNEIQEYLAKAEQQLDSHSHSDERLKQLEEEVERLKKEMGSIAAYLSQERAHAASRLEDAVKRELKDLDMSQVDFKVSIIREESPDGIPHADGNLYRYNGSGIDDIEFITSTNPGEPLKPLARIASTGEISRFMLALKCALAEADTIPVLIFDEIDIGVGGRSGEIVGRKLWDLSKNHQVICVTHLPQIAAFADAHYSVSKESTGDRTTSKIETLDKEARLNELAVMIGGPGYADGSLRTAQELIQKADEWKKTSAGR